MSYQNDKFDIGLAGPQDSEQLLRIYECGDFKGGISVLYTRRPDPYLSLQREGEKAVIPIVTDKENGIIVGMGACVIRKATVNGEIRNTGYLTGLKGLPNYRKRVPSITDTYQFLYDQTRQDVDLYYTTILSENVAVQKMLEKKRKNMPEYRSQGEYTVYCFRTGRRLVRTGHELASGYTLEVGSAGSLAGNREALVKLYQENTSDFNLAPAATDAPAAPAAADLPGLSDDAIYVLRNPQGDAVAACTVWNQQDYKQYIVTEYQGLYKYLKWLPLKLFGYPSLPPANVPANYASITWLAVKDNDVALARYFVQKVAEKSGKFGFLMLGLFANHPLVASMDKIKSIKYKSKLYTVHWPENTLELDQRPIHLEVGLL